MKKNNKMLKHIGIIFALCLCVSIIRDKKVEGATSPVVAVEVVPGTDTADVYFYPEKGMPSTAKYKIFVDGVQNVTINQSDIYTDTKRVEAEANNSNSYGSMDRNNNRSGGINLGGAWIESEDSGKRSPKYVSYNNMDFTAGGYTDISFCYSKVGEYGQIMKMYLDNYNDSGLKDTFRLNATTNYTWDDYTVQSFELSKRITGKHFLRLDGIFDNYSGGGYFINFDYFELSRPCGKATISMTPGYHTVEVQVRANYQNSEKISSSKFYVKPSFKTSVQTGIEGFQIKTNGVTESGDPDVAFRTICKAPSVGSIVTSNGTNYTVAGLGIIYVRDYNETGDYTFNELSKDYTKLSLTTDGNGVYTGLINDIKGNNNTYGYVATENAVISNKNGMSEYVVTMTDGDNIKQNSLYVRAFVVATDGTVIYGDDTAKMSIAEVAHYFYTTSSSTNFTAHNYLYDNILNRLEIDNKFYLAHRVQYGWNNNWYEKNPE
ncbi:MAG: hypothetical protein K6G88_06505 [Lachnospiraceae bacterium]|nr:hypothetical protein [Lachnospiraceae bacterium]